MCRIIDVSNYRISELSRDRIIEGTKNRWVVMSRAVGDDFPGGSKVLGMMVRMPHISAKIKRNLQIAKKGR